MLNLIFDGVLGYITATVFGLLVGSFLNVVIHRLPMMIDREEQCWAKIVLNGDEASDDCEQQRFNLITPRSRCPNCEHLIKWYENIPLISWLLILKGKCSSCKSKISCRYFIVELITGIASLLVALQFHGPSQIIFALLFTWALIALVFIDEAHQLLPDIITLPLMWLGILAALYESQFIDLQTSVIGAMVGYLSLWLVYWAFKLITGKEGMGHGDFKLLAALCAWQGPIYLPYILIIASVLGLIYALSIGLPRGKPMAFGPALAFAGWLCFMYGPYILAFSGYPAV